MWDNNNNDSVYMNYVKSYMNFDRQQMQNMGIDAEAALLDILGKELWNGQVDMGEIKEDRRKYLLIRR